MSTWNWVWCALYGLYAIACWTWLPYRLMRYRGWDSLEATLWGALISIPLVGQVIFVFFSAAVGIERYGRWVHGKVEADEAWERDQRQHTESEFLLRACDPREKDRRH